jgi:curved DNA-binding protein CbpA
VAEKNHFSAFGLEPRPWVDPEWLKQQFLALSAHLHPDKETDPAAKSAAEQGFSALNESYLVLRQSRTRLLHLLALLGAPAQPHVQAVPGDLADFFKPIAELTRQADELARQRQAASSPMLKVQLFEKGLELTGALQDLQAKLSERMEQAEGEIRRLDAAWDQGERAYLAPQLQAAAARFGFVERWQAQLQQRVAALAF